MKAPLRMDRQDFVSAIVLIAFATAVLVESLRMERLEELEINPYTAPGLVPGLLGLMLLACGIALFVRSAIRGGWRLGLSTDGFAEFITSDVARRVALTLALTYGFAIVLFGRLPFGVAAAAFIFAFVVLAERQSAGGARPTLMGLAIALTVAAVAGFGIEAVFRQVFFVKLP